MPHTMALPAALPDLSCANCDTRDHAICAALNDRELEVLCGITTEARLAPRQIVFQEGDDGAFLFNVVSGCLSLAKCLPNGKRQITRFLYAGDFVGLSIAGAYPYSAQAITPAQLCRFPRSALMRLVEEIPTLEHHLLVLASNELVEAREHIILLWHKNASDKIATMLLDLARRLGIPIGQGTRIDAPMSREDMADYLGLTIETVSRGLSALQRAGIIRLPEPRQIEILKPAALEKIAEES